MHQRLGAGNKARTRPPDRRKKALVRPRESPTGYAADQRADGGLGICAPGWPAPATEVGRCGAVLRAVRRGLLSARWPGESQRVGLENSPRHLPAPGCGYRLRADAWPPVRRSPGTRSGRHRGPDGGPCRARSGAGARKRVSLIRCITRVTSRLHDPGTPGRADCAHHLNRISLPIDLGACRISTRVRLVRRTRFT